MISNQYYSPSNHQRRTTTTINCKRSSILRSKELVEIGSCWPRILVLSDDEQAESVERHHCHRTRQRKRSNSFQSINSNPIKVSRRFKHRRVASSCSSPIPILCSQIAPLSPSSATFISIDQNTTSWKPLSSHSTQSSSMAVKTSSLTGRPVNDVSHHLLHDDDKSVGSSGIRWLDRLVEEAHTRNELNWFWINESQIT